MNKTAQILFEYLRDILYDPDRAKLDPERLDEDFKPLGQGLMYLSSSLAELRKFAFALSKGDLNIENLPRGNELTAPLKAMHANLRHLTWQSQQVAKGDYRQRVDFMGEFSDAFNEMTKQLEQRQSALEEEIRISHEKTEALKHSNDLLTEIAFNIPQLLFVLGEKDGEVLFTNKAAQEALDKEPAFLKRLILNNDSEIVDDDAADGADFICRIGNETKYYTLQSYRIFWSDKNALAYALNDISEEQMRRRELEAYAYQDNLTKLFNRFYGIRTLNEWIEEKRHFVLCFADLDNLKYINDTFGHSEGDEYIVRAARELSYFSDSAIACRLGGDEFLLLIPDISEAQVIARMEEIRNTIQKKLKDEEKPYYSNISYGAVESTPDGNISASDIMSRADERMYENKRENKRRRQEDQSKNLP